jgi:membrane dipeptidase
MAVRLFDVHCNWLRQYSAETTTFSRSANAEIPERLKQLAGFMTATSAAVLCCERSAADWELQPDRWRALYDLIVRYEAEFSGRLLIGPADFARWRSEPPDGLTWGMLGVSGLDFLVRDQADLERLTGLFARGGRVFQLVETAKSALAGSSEPGDERGLTELGRSCVLTIAGLGLSHRGEGIPILDLAHLNPRSMAEVMEAVDEAARYRRVLLTYSHGALTRPGFDGPRAIDLENLARLRAKGGLIGLTPGLPFHENADQFKAAIDQVATIPFEGRAGYEGIAIGSDFPETNETLPGLGDAMELVEWVSRNLDDAPAALMLQGNAVRLLATSVGSPSASGV